MPPPTKRENLLTSQRVKKELAEKLLNLGKTRRGRPSTDAKITLDRNEQVVPISIRPPLAAASAGQSKVALYHRLDPLSPMGPQPWTNAIVNRMLEASVDGAVHLCLVWPAYVDSVALFHALATLERFAISDLQGLRTLFFPGRQDTYREFHKWLADRAAMVSYTTENIYKLGEHGTNTGFAAVRPSEAKLALLSALVQLENYSQGCPNPSLAELIPSFIYEQGTNPWPPYTGRLLARSLKKLTLPSYKRDIKAKIAMGLTVAQTATDALLVVHNATRKEDWRSLLKPMAKLDALQPDILLLDATRRAARTNFRAVQRIPEFLETARLNGLRAKGAVIVTDEPATFFMMRKRLGELNIGITQDILNAEGSPSGLSNTPLPNGWVPEVRSNSNFEVAIVDRDASQVAAAFHKIAVKLGNQSIATPPLMEAVKYILRLSNMPAGYKDLSALMGQEEASSYTRERMSWSHYDINIQSMQSAGAFKDLSPDVTQVVERARKLIDSWSDHTPMALKLIADLEKSGFDARKPLAIFFQKREYIELAHMFLKRRFDEGRYSTMVNNVRMLTHRQVTEVLDTAEQYRRKLIFVGLNDEVLRFLVADERVPHGTSLNVSYRNAQSNLISLQGLLSLPSLKSYKGRMGLLAQELEKKIKAFSLAPKLDRINDADFTFNFEERISSGDDHDSQFWRFDLDGRGRAYYSGSVFRYDPDEDPPLIRTSTDRIQIGDCIFDMTDNLKEMVENALEASGLGIAKAASQQHIFLKLYHDDIERRIAALFPSGSKRASAQLIHKRMAELNPRASECSFERVYYWLRIAPDVEAPHASASKTFFGYFCTALEIPEQQAENYWIYIKNVRRLNQATGRALAAQYAEIIFHPEDVETYRRIPRATILKLKAEALHCVYPVVRIHPPIARKGND